MKTKKSKKRRFKKKEVILTIILILIIFPVITGIYHFNKSIPKGISYQGTNYNVSESDIDFLYDLTYEEDNEKKIEQEIFDEIFKIVDEAEKFILIDMFLFNTDYSDKVKFKELTTILKDKLINKKKQNPEIEITFITDPINNFYGSYEAEHLTELKENNINVIITDLKELRDINPLWSGPWRVYFQWFGTLGKGWITHPLGNKNHKVTLRSWFELLNIKANHRKVIIADNNDQVVSLITSANPHEASSLHSNVAVLIKSKIWVDILETEKAVAELSKSEIKLPKLDIKEFNNKSFNENINVQLLTERRIKESLLKELKNTQKGESIDIAMFYFSDRDILKELLDADKRGVDIRLILDPNKDAFAREKNGIPNRQIAYELIKNSRNIKIKWYNSKGEQFHTKIVIIKKKNKIIVFLGSSNLTKRNLNNFNLESDVKMEIPPTNLSSEITQYYDRLWNNKNGDYTLDFDSFEDSSKLKFLIYWMQENTGISSF